jgi:hypothetical protein
VTLPDGSVIQVPGDKSTYFLLLPLIFSLHYSHVIFANHIFLSRKVPIVNGSKLPNIRVLQEHLSSTAAAAAAAGGGTTTTIMTSSSVTSALQMVGGVGGAAFMAEHDPVTATNRNVALICQGECSYFYKVVCRRP